MQHPIIEIRREAADPAGSRPAFHRADFGGRTLSGQPLPGEAPTGTGDPAMGERRPRHAVEDAALLASFQDWLEPGERVEAVHRPAPAQLLRWTLIAWVVFLPWTVFCFDWLTGLGFDEPIPAFGTASAGADAALQWFRFAALPFLAVGVGGLLLPFWSAWRGKATRHVVTDRREFTVEADLLTRVVRRRPGRVTSSPNERGERFLDSSGAAIGGLSPVLQSRVSHPLAR